MTGEYTIYYSGRALSCMFRENISTVHVRHIIDDGKTMQEFTRFQIPYLVIAHEMDGRHISVSCVRIEHDVIVESVCSIEQGPDCGEPS